ncbi:hypothetical protein FRB95_010930 [Tulasnella sp. JGI-2019a]|nr:hypothetical protein FRB95_010930 [Tulasnella sp. JGI-2019a]
MDDSLMLRFDPLSSPKRATQRTPSDQENITPNQQTPSPTSAYFNRPHDIFAMPPPRKKLHPGRESLVDISMDSEEGQTYGGDGGFGQSILGDLVGWQREKVGRPMVREPLQNRNPFGTWLEGIGEDNSGDFGGCGTLFTATEPSTKATPIKVAQSSWPFSPDHDCTPATSADSNLSGEAPITIRPNRALQRPMPALIPLPETPKRPMRPMPINYADSPPQSLEENDEDDTIRLVPRAASTRSTNALPRPHETMVISPMLSPQRIPLPADAEEIAIFSTANASGSRIPSPHRVPLPLDGEELSLFDTPDPSRTGSLVLEPDEYADTLPSLCIAVAASLKWSPRRIPLPLDEEELSLLDTPDPSPKNKTEPFSDPILVEQQYEPLTRSTSSRSITATPMPSGASSPRRIPLPSDDEDITLMDIQPLGSSHSETFPHRRPVHQQHERIAQSPSSRLSLDLGELILEGASFDLVHDEMIFPDNKFITSDEDHEIFFPNRTPNVFARRRTASSKEESIPEADEPMEDKPMEPDAVEIPSVPLPPANDLIQGGLPPPATVPLGGVSQPSASLSTLTSQQRSHPTRSVPAARAVPLLRRRDSSLVPPTPYQSNNLKPLPLVQRLKSIRLTDAIENPEQKRTSVIGPRLSMAFQSRVLAPTASSEGKGKAETPVGRRLGVQARTGAGPPSVVTRVVDSLRPRPSVSTLNGAKQATEGVPGAGVAASSSRTVIASASGSRTGALSRANSAASLTAPRTSILPTTIAATIKPSHLSHRSTASTSTIPSSALVPPRSSARANPAIPAGGGSRPATVIGMASRARDSSAFSGASRLPSTLRPASRAAISTSRARGTGLLGD